ncbi:hypothetical protein EV122DRAFT_278840 [Schizophyllum commune]
MAINNVLGNLRTLHVACVHYPDHVVQDRALLRMVQRLASSQPPQLSNVEFWVPVGDVDRLRDLAGATYASVLPTTSVKVMVDPTAEEPHVWKVRGLVTYAYFVKLILNGSESKRFTGYQ